MQCVIMAAGKGTRLLPITRKRTKAMLPILGKPIVDRVLESLKNDQVNEFILVVSPNDHEIIDYFQPRSSTEVKVRFAYQAEPLGTADALRCAAPLIKGDFVLTSCDNLLLKGDIQRLFKAWIEEPRPNAILTLMSVSMEMIKRSGMVELKDGWVKGIVEKPRPEEAPSNVASLPLYCLPFNILEYLSDIQRSMRGEYELQDAIQMLIERKGFVRGVMVSNRLTLTRPDDLLQINRHYLSINPNQVHIESKSIGSNTQLMAPLYVEAGSVIGKNCLLRPYVYIEGDCYIGDGAVIQDAVVLQGAKIPQGAKVSGEVVS